MPKEWFHISKRTSQLQILDNDFDMEVGRTKEWFSKKNG
jgi:hypothetical protein